MRTSKVQTVIYRPRSIEAHNMSNGCGRDEVTGEQRAELTSYGGVARNRDCKIDEKQYDIGPSGLSVAQFHVTTPRSMRRLLDILYTWSGGADNSISLREHVVAGSQIAPKRRN